MLQPQNVMDQQNQLYQSQRALPETSSTSLDSTAQTGHATGGDWQEEVFQKIKVMKEMYLPELSEMYQKIATKLQQHDSLPQQPKSEQLDKLKMFRTMLERLISVLQISKSSISPGLKDKLFLYEKQIVNFINTNRPRKPVSSLQQGQLPPPHMHSMQQSQSQITQVQSHENQMNPQLQSMNFQGSVATMPQSNMTSLQQSSMSAKSLDCSYSTAQTGHATGGDWQEEVFQKIKFMKEMYLPELSEMYQKIATKLQQHDSLPQQPKSEKFDKLKMFRTMLERLISVLQISKSSISPGLKDKLLLYEKQVVNFINTNRPTKPVSSLHQWAAPTAAPPT